MTAKELLAELSRLGVRLEPRLRVDAPPGSLSPELREALGQNRDEMIELLIAEHRRNEEANAKAAARPSERHAGILW